MRIRLLVWRLLVGGAVGGGLLLGMMAVASAAVRCVRISRLLLLGVMARLYGWMLLRVGGVMHAVADLADLLALLSLLLLLLQLIALLQLLLRRRQ